MHRILHIAITFSVFILAGCGQGKVNITSSTFDPKIVIQGLLTPGQTPTIKIRRNFALNADGIDPADIVLPQATVVISDAAGTQYPLTYSPLSQSYESAALLIDYGTTYTLTVDATIDGRTLQASSVTTTPLAGLDILESASRLGSRVYRARDDQGNVQEFNALFERSPGTGAYVISLVSLDADTSTFIYDSPFLDIPPEDVIADFEEFKYNYFWIRDRPLTPGVSNAVLQSFNIFFYGRYRVIIYAADENFRDFQLTHEVTQAVDGNFHEPAFHISGDGIGAFGSAVVDSAYFEVLRP